MKKVLITGKDSYIGTSFEKYINDNYPGAFVIDTVDMTNEKWREKDFSKYDTIFHVAGIAHSDIGKVNDNVKQKYYKVNTCLAIETAKKAKEDGAKQFVFMSSIIVFGSKNKVITSSTLPAPDNFYGDSKLQADIELHKLQSDEFNVVSVRPPMVYGKGCKGNYPKLVKIAKKMPFFPACNNERSMIYIDNLCEVIKLIITDSSNGYFYPQNKEYVNVTELVKEVNPRIKLTKIFNPFIKRFNKTRIVKKVFGTMVYEKDMSSCFDFKYCIKDFKTSVKETGDFCEN